MGSVLHLLVRATRIGTSLLVLSLLACAEPGAHTDAAPTKDGGTDSKPATSPLGLFCSPGVNPTDPFIADFSSGTFNGNTGRWGGNLNLTLFIYDYRDPGNPGSSSANSLDGEAFNFSGQVPGDGDSYAGGGIHFDSCVNTTTYTGVQYKLTGSTGGCTVYFELQTYTAEPINERGGCASYCFQFPRTAVAPRSTLITIPFALLDGTGLPATAAGMASDIMGLRWQVEAAPAQGDAGRTGCTFDLTVDDVRFVK